MTIYYLLLLLLWLALLIHIMKECSECYSSVMLL